MIVSLANSIRFYKVDSNLPNFDNQSYRDTILRNHIIYDYRQMYYSTDSIKIQVKQDIAGSAPTAKAYGPNGQELLTFVVSQVSAYTSYKYYEFTISMTAFTSVECFDIQITDGTDTYRSNPVEVVAEDDYLQSVQWSNNENNFEIDYSTGIEHALRIEGYLRLGPAGGEQSVYDNQEEIIKLQDEVKRIMNWQIRELPEQLCETLAIAVAHDNFFINEIQYTAEGKPDYSGVDLNNTREFNIDLTQKIIIGLNTHDTGFNVDDMSAILNLQQDNATGDFTFTVTEDYLIQSVTMEYNAGTGVKVRMGTAVDQNDVVYDTELRSGQKITETVNLDITDGADATLYVGIDGTSADVDIKVILIRNVQAS